MLKFIRKFRGAEEGVTAIEYGLIAALVGVAIIVGATALGDSLNAIFNNVSTTLDAAAPAAPAAPAG